MGAVPAEGSTTSGAPSEWAARALRDSLPHRHEVSRWLSLMPEDRTTVVRSTLTNSCAEPASERNIWQGEWSGSEGELGRLL